ncbi:type VI secretion system baseplate subunit TssF [Pelomonas sp. KK5]|uniref:type VI secretion system baseplate subunit TssF n=1 Tax=Pelomonas sp. KK5 TaxID=1855730 RepID=UPI00097BA9B3|nr:type VI secretion system baseplate subunit TssF [Pelomonas sp. KK5]
MDPRLLAYFNEELSFMRESAAGFAAQHPKVARRLGMHGIEVADPYVERLIEAFCFMSARMRLKLDAEFPRFTERLLEVLYPNYISPTPSMAVAQFFPDARQGDFSKGFAVPRGTPLYAAVPAGEVTACEFRTGQDLRLWPVEIVEAKLGGVPPDIPSLGRHLPAHVRLQGSLRLRLRTTGALKFSELQGLDEISVYLSGAEALASHLHELIHAGGAGSVTGVPQQLDRQPHVVIHGAVAHEGLAPGQSLLPLPWNVWHGHNLLHEYFACPARFYFFRLTQLAPALSRIEGNEAEVVILLTRAPGALTGLVDARQFALHCTPVVNLFPMRTDRIELRSDRSEHHIVPDRTRPTDFEVFSITSLQGLRGSTAEPQTFRALYQTLNQDEGNHGRYFSLRREPRLASDSARKYGTRTPYIGTEVFASLVDQHEAPYADELRYLQVEALLTNRDLPRLVPRNGRQDLTLAESVPVSGVGLLREPTVPRPPHAQGETAWRLIRQLNYNYLPLTELSHREGAQGLRDMLRLFVGTDNAVAERQVASLVGCRIEPETRRLPGSGPLVYGRGVHVALTVDEDNFSGTSPYQLGLVLDHYFARHVAINVFSRTSLAAMQRGRVADWAPRMGLREAA